MRITKRIKSEDRLAQLFNKYLDLLFTYEQVKWPSYMSMSEFNEEKKDRDSILRMYESAMGLYGLIILNESLHNLHDCIERSISYIDNYQSNYNNDWKFYATSERIKNIEEGGGSDGDYNEDNTIKYLEDFESLKHYTIKRDVGCCFSVSDMRGENIGTSSKEDYADMSILVRHNTDFCITKFFESNGTPLTMYIENPDTGDMEPMPLAEKIEKEINEDIINNNVVEIFNLVFDKCKEVELFYLSIPDFSNEKEMYSELKNKLECIRDLKF